MSKVEISVIMAVYNEEKFLSETIQSVLDQTFSNFEFIIINDASTDGSLDIINSYNDSRIFLYNNKNNLGIAKSLNKGFEFSNGNYIARIDANDIAMPNRFEKQVNYFNNNTDTGLVGTLYNYVDEKSNFIRKGIYNFFSPKESVSYLAFYNICHSTIMFKRSLVKRIKGPYQKRPAEDFQLYLKIAEIRGCYILNEVLMNIRIHNHGIWSNNQIKIQNDIHHMRLEKIKSLGVQVSKAENKIHKYLIDKDYKSLEKISFKNIYNWIKKIIYANDKKNYFPIYFFNHELYIRIGRLFLFKKTKSIINIVRIFHIFILLGKKKNIIDFIYFIRSN